MQILIYQVWGGAPGFYISSELLVLWCWCWPMDHTEATES